jgi:hypothetical protein
MLEKSYPLKQNMKIIGYVKAILRDGKSGKIKKIVKGKNLIVTVGMTAILRRMGNDALVANEGMITYGAVGDGAVNPALIDTVMENELDRKLVAVTSVTGTTLTIETFFAEAEAIGTLTKFALFGEDATGVADSGTLFEYIKFSASITKTASDTLSVTSTITLANA